MLSFSNFWNNFEWKDTAEKHDYMSFHGRLTIALIYFSQNMNFKIFRNLSLHQENIRKIYYLYHVFIMGSTTF